MPAKRTVAERFWEKVDQSEDGCWLWKGNIDNHGYGRIGRGGRGGGNLKSHRVSWFYAYGEIPDGMCVLHKCDVPACVRPDHLFLGTKADNMTDMARKRRTPLAKLTDEEVRTIRARRGKGESRFVLAAEYGVSPSTIWDLADGHRRYQHVDL